MMNLKHAWRTAAMALVLAAAWAQPAAAKPAIPVHAHVVGKSWACDAGYAKSGSLCKKIVAPTNGYVSGNGWLCKTGFKKVGTSCIAMPAPVALPPVGGPGYVNVDGIRVPSPVHAPSAPAGASAQCRDGSYSFSLHRRGTCAHHGGVASWL